MIGKLREAVLRGDKDGAASLTEEALGAGNAPEKILNNGLISAMDVVGKEFESGERFIPEMLVAAEAMKAALSILRPKLLEQGVQSKGKVVIGTVQGDLHDIGKDLVATMLEGAGFEIVDLGVDVDAEQFVNAVRAHQPQVLALSALLTTTMPAMPEVIGALSREGLRANLRVIVGGAPVSQRFAETAGADGYADDAAQAVALVKTLVTSMR